MTSTRTNETTAKAASLNDIGGVSFDPDIGGAGLVVNLDASIEGSIGFAGDKVSSWTDQKNSFVFAQTTDANRPLHGVDSIRFDGNQYLSTPAEPDLNLTATMSIFIVATVDDIVNNTFTTFWSHTSGASGYAFGHGNTPPGEARFNFSGVSDLNSNEISFQDGVRSSVGVVFGGGTFDYQKNGRKLGTTKSTAPANSANVTTLIGAAEGNTDLLRGDIHQILIYNTKISGANLTTIGEGLYNKWRL
jgi:hypothetical protein